MKVLKHFGPGFMTHLRCKEEDGVTVSAMMTHSFLELCFVSDCLNPQTLTVFVPSSYLLSPLHIAPVARLYPPGFYTNVIVGISSILFYGSLIYSTMYRENFLIFLWWSGTLRSVSMAPSGNSLGWRIIYIADKELFQWWYHHWLSPRLAF